MMKWCARLCVAVVAGFLFVSMASTFAMAKDISTGPIWNNQDAQGKCPGVCSAAGRTWDGNWTTTVPGTRSACSCTHDKKHDGKTRSFNAGPIWNNADAQTKCPAVCISHDRSWNGNWVTTQEGRMSQCECRR